MNKGQNLESVIRKITHSSDSSDGSLSPGIPESVNPVSRTVPDPIQPLAVVIPNLMAAQMVQE